MPAFATHIPVPADGGASELMQVPFAPGEAPFRVKGNAYRGHLQYVRDEVPGGMEAQAEALRALHPERGEAWAQFMNQTFLASGWYDVYPLVIGGIACANVVGCEFLEFVHDRSCQQARSDIKGIHKFLLKFISTKAIAVRVPMLASQYFDFVTVQSKVVDKVQVRGELAGVPVAIAPWWAAMSRAYIGTVTEISGKIVPEITSGPYVAEGDVHGVSVCTVHTLVTMPG